MREKHSLGGFGGMNDLGWKRRFENKKINMVEIINEQNHLMKRKDIITSRCLLIRVIIPIKYE